MGNGGGKDIGGRLQSGDTNPKHRKFFTNCICVGCGCADGLCSPILAGELRCCCLESATRVDVEKCDQCSELCAARAGCKLGPAVADVKNPLIDNHELVVVCEKKVWGCDNGHAIGGKIQSSDTMSKSKKWFTNCVCVGCGCSDDLCRPMCAEEFRCCCLEHATRVDVGKCDECHELCAARAGCKVLPAVCHVTNPLIDNHELIVVCEKKVYGC